MQGDAKRPNEKTQAVGVAWYRREQWPRLLEISADRDTLEDSYDEWLAHASNTFEFLKRNDLSPIQVDIDTEELLAWCRARNLPVNADARTNYTAGIVKQLCEPPRGRPI